MYRIIKLPKKSTITVVGDVFQEEKLFERLINKIEPSPENILVSVGNLNENIANKYFNNGFSYIIRGNSEQADIFSDNVTYPSLLAASFIFSNQIKITIVHGGVSPKHNENDLNSNLELVYLSYIGSDNTFIPMKYEDNVQVPIYEGKLWHKVYDGRFGYIISGNNLKRDSEIRSFQHSCNIDTSCDKTGVLSAIKYSEHKREEIIQVSN